MLRLKIEVDSSVFVNYPLFWRRCHLIFCQVLCMIFSILSLLIFGNSSTTPAWITLVILCALSIFLCLNDMGLHALRKKSPNHTSLPQSPSPAYRATPKPPRNTVPRYTEEVPVYEEVEGTLYPVAESRSADLEQGAPLLTPSISNSSEPVTSTVVNSYEHFQPSPFITACDLFMAFAQFTLYLTTIIVESVTRSRWGSDRNGYGLKLHADLLTLVCVYMHLRCFWIEIRALKKGNRNLFTYVLERR